MIIEYITKLRSFSVKKSSKEKFVLCHSLNLYNILNPMFFKTKIVFRTSLKTFKHFSFRMLRTKFSVKLISSALFISSPDNLRPIKHNEVFFSRNNYPIIFVLVRNENINTVGLRYYFQITFETITLRKFIVKNVIYC